MQPIAHAEATNSTYGAPYVAGNFAPLMNEVTAFDLQVVGRIPEALTGRFLRVGPNPVDEPDTEWLHGYNWLAGTGMVHGLRLREGRPEWFRSRFILDQHTARIRGKSRFPVRARARATPTSTRTSH
ncbi:carotenoid oxygenase family protein [Nannocystis pusilla]|uniref:carotenoid oxygenase family protein n=1 Tax=Nannocystis pusilla TaxID=889268 RepID=UPI003B7B8D7D